MKKRDETRQQDESSEAMECLAVAFGDEGLRRSEKAIGDLLHFIDDNLGPKVALVWQIRLLGLTHLISYRETKKHVRLKSKKEFVRRFGTSFDITLDCDEIGGLPLYE